MLEAKHGVWMVAVAGRLWGWVMSYRFVVVTIVRLV